jgi:hypothetical protein
VNRNRAKPYIYITFIKGKKLEKNKKFRKDGKKRRVPIREKESRKRSRSRSICNSGGRRKSERRNLGGCDDRQWRSAIGSKTKVFYLHLQ